MIKKIGIVKKIFLYSSYPTIQGLYGYWNFKNENVFDRYATEFQKLRSYCSEHQIAIQTIKAIARGYWGNNKDRRKTWYEPLSDEKAIALNVHWGLGIPELFLNTVGDLKELPEMLKAASNFKQSI